MKLRWIIGRFRLIKRLRKVETTVSLIKRCAGCGVLVDISSERVTTIEIADEPGRYTARCRWCYSEFLHSPAGRDLRRRQRVM